MKTDDVLKLLDGVAPIAISDAFVAAGSYDNVGAIVDLGEEIRSAVFSLDLSLSSVAFARERGSNLIVTHHPAIYRPVARLDAATPLGGALIGAIRSGISVISMHLNLDASDNGIDETLARALGATTFTVLHLIYGEKGYGKEFTIPPVLFSEYLSRVKERFASERIVAYGPERTVKKVASFCGGGSDDAIAYGGDADVIVTSDAPHHIIKELVERGKNLILLPHYTAEEKGFFAFYERVRPMLGFPVSYFKDERFI